MERSSWSLLSSFSSFSLSTCSGDFLELAISSSIIPPTFFSDSEIEGIFGNLGKSTKNAEIEFKNSNVLWRATLKSLDFLPLVNADYAGGIIIYDWYSDNINSKEQIKITVKFLSNELRSDSIEIISHKKICDENNKCSISMLKNNLSNEIKDKILSSAISIKIEEKRKDN